jgi:3-oxoacyl-[acyl-carrier-protein] synthase II
MAFALLALRDGFSPPTINLRVPDPECDLDYVANAGRKIETDAALSLSTGFGGQIGAIVARRL